MKKRIAVKGARRTMLAASSSIWEDPSCVDLMKGINEGTTPFTTRTRDLPAISSNPEHVENAPVAYQDDYTARIKTVTEECRQFLSKYFDGIEDGYVELRTKSNRGKRARIFISLASYDGLFEFIRKHYKDSRIWFGVAPRFMQVGTKEGINQILSLFTDVDLLTTEEKKKGLPDEEIEMRKDDFLLGLASFPFYPSIIVDSATGFHLYWLLREPFEINEASRSWDIDKIENLNGLILKYFEGDDSAKDISRVLGLPFTLNHKYNPPKPVSIYQADFDRRYNICEFEEFFEDYVFPEKNKNPDNKDSSSIRNEGDKLYKQASEDIPKGKRKSVLVSLAGKLFSSSLDYNTVLATLNAKNDSLSDPLGKKEIIEIVDSIYKSDQKSNPVRYFNEKPEPIERLLIPSAPVFPLDKLPLEMRHYIEDEANRMQVPYEFIAIPLFVSTAGIIRSRVALYPKKLDSWCERPCLWGCIIASPGTLKSPAFKRGISPLSRIQAKITEDFSQKNREWMKRKAESSKSKVEFNEEPPKDKRLLTTDATIEKLGSLIQISGGITLARDELSGFISNLNRYTNGSDKQFFLEGYSGGIYNIDRMTRDSVHISDHYINIVGTIQPSVAREIFFNNNKDDGFFDRFTLLAYPEFKNDWHYVDEKPSEYISGYYDLCDKLFKLFDSHPSNVLHGAVRWDDEAQEIFIDWFRDHMVYLNSIAEDDPMRSVMGKVRGSVVRLALVFHCIEVAAGRAKDIKIAGKDALLSSIALHEDFFIPTWRRVHAAFAESVIESGTKKIAQWILKDRVESFTLRDIRRKAWKEFSDDDPERNEKRIEVVLKDLITARWVNTEATRKGTSRYIVNPEVWA
jgi:hypothetical protein